MTAADEVTTDLESPTHWRLRLPGYEHPPVVETVMAARIQPLRAFSSVELLEFWNRSLRAVYPVAEEQPLYAAPIEEFGDGPPASSIRVNLTSAPDPRRFWLRGETGEDLVQVQHDWIAFNWRKPSDDAKYRDYAYGRGRFVELYSALQSFADTEGLGPIVPVQAEVSYINHVHALRAGASPTLNDVLSEVTAPRPGGMLPKSEGQTYTARYVAHDKGGKPYARLHVQANPIFTDESPESLLSLRLTFRGKPQEPDLEGVLATLDDGHDWIVKGFDEITTDQYHEQWQKKEPS